MRSRRDPVYSDVEAVALWLGQASGQSAIRSTLAKLRLPAYFDSDLESALLYAAEQEADKGKRIENVAAWASLVLRRRAMDLFKRPAVRDRRRPQDAEGQTLDLDAFERTDDPLADALASIDLDLLRTSLLWSTDAPPQRSSASLTILAVGVAKAEPGQLCPSPVGGAGPLEAAEWAGLWYSGQRSCFPSAAEEDSATIRKRRNRAVIAVREELRAVFHSNGGAADAR